MSYESKRRFFEISRSVSLANTELLLSRRLLHVDSEVLDISDSAEVNMTKRFKVTLRARPAFSRTLPSMCQPLGLEGVRSGDFTEKCHLCELPM
jgi:hypothetical protein